MKSITIDIKRLGAIRDSHIKLAPVMIFSGESGLGKSYLAILCHYMFDVLLDDTRINRFINKFGYNFSAMRGQFKDSGVAIRINKSDLEEWLSEDAIQYMSFMLNYAALSGSLSIKLPNEIPSVIEVSFEEEISEIGNQTEVYVKLSALNLTYRVKEQLMGEESPFAFLLRYGLMNVIFGDFKALSDTFVFPPSRGPVLTEEVIPRSGLYEKFKNSLLKIDRIPPHSRKIDEDLIDLFHRVLDGSVYRKEGNYIYETSEAKLPISAAAASIRELAPLAMLSERTDVSTISMLIEEPEAHLHPLKQRTMADVISLFGAGGAFMQITTHSDYFLRRINELIGLKRIHQKSTEDDFLKVCVDLQIDPKLEFDYNRLSAYLLERNEDGTARIIEQDLCHGVPFSSFSSAIDDSLKNRYLISNHFVSKDCE